MIKYLFLILVTLLSGCTADFSGSCESEESVYIRFSSYVDVKADVEEASYAHRQVTRSDNYVTEQAVGILGIAAHEDMMDEITLVGRDATSLRKWMQNDVYYRNPMNGAVARADGQCPTFPIEKGSAVVAYAYMPYTDSIVYGDEDCYIPLDLVADSASTDWTYSGSSTMSKSAYHETGVFVLDSFKHVMTCLEVIVDTPKFDEMYDTLVRILEISLGVRGNGKGRLSLTDGMVTMADAENPDSIYRLQRKPGYRFSIYEQVKSRTETFYLMPYTEIHDLRVVALWNEADTIRYEYVIADSAKWNTANLRPGVVSRLKLKSIKNNDLLNNEEKHL